MTRSNHHAAGAKGSDLTYTLGNTMVSFGNDANPPAAGDPLHVIGKISALGKTCTPVRFHTDEHGPQGECPGNEELTDRPSKPGVRE